LNMCLLSLRDKYREKQATSGCLQAASALLPA
jgi:hypothetical protein